MTTVLSNIPASREVFGKLAEIPEDIVYANDEALDIYFHNQYTIWKREEEPQSIYVTNKEDNSKIVKFGELEELLRCPHRSKALVEKARKTLTEILFKEAIQDYEEQLASTKSEKKKKMLFKPSFSYIQSKVFRLCDYEVFMDLEYNGYFVFEQKESLTDYGNEGREVLLKVDKNENN